MRKIEFWVEVHELNEQGEYTPVEVVPKPEVPSAGVFQLRQVKQLTFCYKFHLFIYTFYIHVFHASINQTNTHYLVFIS